MGVWDRSGRRGGLADLARALDSEPRGVGKAGGAGRGGGGDGQRSGALSMNIQKHSGGLKTEPSLKSRKNAN